MKEVKSKTTKKAAVKTTKKVSTTNVDTGEDLYVVIGIEKHQFSSQTSAIYDVKEYYFKGTLTKDAKVKFTHADGREVPVHQSANCGYTLVGKAQNYFKANKALCASGEASDDQEYVYINEHSSLTYIGETGEHTLYVRVYDNLSGDENDRWVVIYLD